MDQAPIPFHVPTIGDEEIGEVAATLRSGWLTSGPRTARFEQDFREYVGARHALAVNSCTAGLHLALAALRIGPGDEVITTPLTFCATVNTIIHVGAVPVLADVGPDGNIDPASIAERLTERTRAIVPVHLAGLPCDMEAIWSLARSRGLAVVEDAAHAVGSRYRGRPIGSSETPSDSSEPGDRSDAVAFSFYATKTMTTGEGGMVTTHREDLAETMKVLCLHGISKDAWNRYSDKGTWFYEVLEAGFKYNLSDIQAAIGIHQLRKLEAFIETRARYAEMYATELEGVDEIDLPPTRDDCRHSWHLYAIRLNLDALAIDRRAFIELLKARGIGTSVHFIPIPLHPYFRTFGTFRTSRTSNTGAASPENSCPRALALYRRLVSLPLYPAMTEEQVRRVASTIKDIVRANRRTSVAAVGGAAAGPSAVTVAGAAAGRER
jgi:dTDP-4-amino-4,6-dideoxygalactose transaminase